MLVAKELVCDAGETSADLEEDLVEWRSDGPQVRTHVARMYNGRAVAGLITKYAPETDADPAMWHMVHEDGDSEDLSKAELEAAISMYVHEFGSGKRSTAAAGTSRVTGRRTTAIDIRAAFGKRPRRN